MEALQCLFPTLRPLYKVFWVILFIAATLIRMPFWCTYFLFKSARQHPKWTWRQSLCTRIFRAFIQIISLVRLRTRCDLKPGKEKERFIVMPPAQEGLYTGIITADPEIRPTNIGGTWYPSCIDHANPLKDVVLHFHGGGYTLGDGRTADCGFGASSIHLLVMYFALDIDSLQIQADDSQCTSRCSYLLRVPYLRPRHPAFQHHYFG